MSEAIELCIGVGYLYIIRASVEMYPLSQASTDVFS